MNGEKRALPKENTGSGRAVRTAAARLGIPPEEILVWRLREDGTVVIINRSGQKWIVSPLKEPGA